MDLGFPIGNSISLWFLFFLIFSFNFLIKIFIGMYLFRLIHLGITQILTSIGLCLSPNLGNFTYYFFKYSFSPTFLYSTSGTLTIWILDHSWLFHKTLLLSLFSVYFLCYLDLISSIILSSSLLIYPLLSPPHY